MISALVINVTTAIERRNFQSDQLTTLKIPFGFLTATSMDVNEALEFSKDHRQWQRPIRHTEVAAMVSHKRAWQAVLDVDEPILILEDDAVLAPQVGPFLKTLEKQTQLSEIDCITLEVRLRKKWIQPKAFADIILPSSERISLHGLIQDRSGLAAYILTPQGAKKLLAYNNKKLGLADALVWETYSLKAFQTVPALCTQADRMSYYGKEPPIAVDSTINAGAAYAKPQIKHRLIRFIAQVRHAVRLTRFAFRSKRVDIPLIDFEQI